MKYLYNVVRIINGKHVHVDWMGDQISVINASTFILVFSIFFKMIFFNITYII